jgi:hypothetical protein
MILPSAAVEAIGKERISGLRAEEVNGWLFDFEKSCSVPDGLTWFQGVAGVRRSV